MKVKLYDLWAWMIIAAATGITLIFSVVLDTWRTVLALIIPLFTLIYLMTHRRKRSEKNKFLPGYLTAFFLIVAFEAFYAKRLFGYTINELLYGVRQYIWLLFAVPLYYIIEKTDDFDEKLITISKIIMLSLYIRAFTWLVNYTTGLIIFRDILYEFGSAWFRNDRPRIEATCLIGVLIPLLAYLFDKYRKRKYAAEIIFVFVYLLLIAQTRTLIAGFLACLCTMIFFKRRSSGRKFAIQLFILILAAFFYVLGGVDIVLSQFDMKSGSLSFRIYEIQYYSQLLSDSRWNLTGFGILSGLNKAASALLNGNAATPMYLSDMGILECYFQFGIFSFFLYGALYVYMIYVINKCSRKNEFEYSFYLIGQLVYIVVVSIPSNLFGVERIFSVSVILAIVCSISKRIDTI